MVTTVIIPIQPTLRGPGLRLRLLLLLSLCLRAVWLLRSALVCRGVFIGAARGTDGDGVMARTGDTDTTDTGVTLDITDTDITGTATLDTAMLLRTATLVEATQDAATVPPRAVTQDAAMRAVQQFTAEVVSTAAEAASTVAVGTGKKV